MMREKLLENMEFITSIDAPPLTLFKEMDGALSSWGCLGLGNACQTSDVSTAQHQSAWSPAISPTLLN